MTPTPPVVTSQNYGQDKIDSYYTNVNQIVATKSDKNDVDKAWDDPMTHLTTPLPPSSDDEDDTCGDDKPAVPHTKTLPPDARSNVLIH